MKFNTADLCDANLDNDNITIANPIGLKDYGGQTQFYGQIHTLKCYEDHSWVEKALAKDGGGKVLVIDGGASLHCAIVGDRLASLAVKNNWNGIIINGAIRDSVMIAKLPIGLKALGTYPISNTTENEWQENVGVQFAGINFWPDQFIYSDEDGIITSKVALL